MAEIYSWVKNIIIFLILTTIITNLLGKSSYKKYVDLVIGIILVLLVVSPLLKFFQLEETLDYFFSANSLLADAEDINGKLEDMEDVQMTTIVSEYEEEISRQVGNLLSAENLQITDVTVTVDEDEKSQTFGSLKSMDIKAKYTTDESDVDTNKISPIKIDKIEIGDKKKENAGLERNYLTPDEINAKNLLSDFYNMNPDNINISIQEH
jgi:stage III sporulation protein AF